MSKTIHKYTIGEYQVSTKKAIIPLPVFAKILSAQIQKGVLVLWASHDADKSLLQDRTIIIAETGEEIEEKEKTQLVFISTVQTASGSFIYHIFEEVEDVG